MRINKYLAEYGGCSRREADRLIEAGYVTINDRLATLGASVDPERDLVALKGEVIGARANTRRSVYYAFHKPAGVISTSSDPQGRKTVISYFPKNNRVYSVGRLDAESSGLIFVTNDGDFTQKLSHPRYKKEKEYIVTMRPIAFRSKTDESKKVQKEASFIEVKTAFLKGLRLDEGNAKADSVVLVEASKTELTVRIVLHQGWNRQIRRMAEKIGYKVTALHRMRIGKIKLSGIRSGQYRELSAAEVRSLIQD